MQDCLTSGGVPTAPSIRPLPTRGSRSENVTAAASGFTCASRAFCGRHDQLRIESASELRNCDRGAPAKPLATSVDEPGSTGRSERRQELDVIHVRTTGCASTSRSTVRLRGFSPRESRPPSARGLFPCIGQDCMISPTACVDLQMHTNVGATGCRFGRSRWRSANATRRERLGVKPISPSRHHQRREHASAVV